MNIQDIDIDDDPICDEDYVIMDSGPLGCNYTVNRLGDFADYDAMIQAIREDMEKDQFWPNVWYINDHGNAMLISMSEA